VRVRVVADADTLFPAATRGLLIYLDYHDLIRLHWSPLILGELRRALIETGRKKTLADAKTHEERMRDALPNALIAVEDVQTRFQAVAAAVRSVKDVHVAACAYHLVAAGVYPETETVTLATRNTKDFRRTALARLGIALLAPDEFLAGLLEAKPREFMSAFRQFRTDLASRPEPRVLLDRLKEDGQVRTAHRLVEFQQKGGVEL